MRMIKLFVSTMQPRCLHQVLNRRGRRTLRQPIWPHDGVTACKPFISPIAALLRQLCPASLQVFVSGAFLYACLSFLVQYLQGPQIHTCRRSVPLGFSTPSQRTLLGVLAERLRPVDIEQCSDASCTGID